jgi:hypothetical protein
MVLLDPVEHIRLPLRKALCCHLLFLENTVDLESELAHRKESRHYTELRSELYRLAAEGSVKPAPVGRLDAFVHQTFVELQQRVREPGKAALATAVERFVDEARKLSCDTCAGTALPVCKDTPSDDLTVADAGHCIQPIRRIFAEVLRTTSAYYARYSSLFSKEMANLVEFSTSASGTKPHSFVLSHGVGGMCRTLADRRSRVELKVWFEDSPESQVLHFDRGDYTLIPAVLFHECVCHAFSGLAAPSGKRQDTLPDDPFAEGWMDWIAHEVMAEVWEGRGIVETGERHRSEQLEALGALHAARLESGQAGSGTFRYGKRAGERAEKCFWEITGSRQEARECLYRLSFDMNLLGGTAYATTFNDLAAFLPSMGTSDPLPRTPETYKLCALLAQYVKHGDPGRFSRELSALRIGDSYDKRIEQGWAAR